MGRPFLLALTLAMLAAAPAHASRLSFAAGNETVSEAGHSAIGFPTAASYWDIPRDLSVFTPKLWRVLDKHRTPISFELRYRRDFGPRPADKPRDAMALRWLRRASKHRIPVTAWLEVPYDDGYWAYEGNADLMRVAAEQFDRWARRHKLKFASVLLDLEASIKDAQPIAELSTNPAGALAALADNAGPARQCRAAEQYRGIVRYLRQRGYSVIAAAYPYIIDDARDGLAAFSDFFDLPLFARGQYDDVAFMTMRTVYIASYGADPGPSLQTSYGADISKLYGREGGISLGVAGMGPYEKLENAIEDVRAAAGSVEGSVGFFSLEKAVKAYGVDGLERLIQAGEHPLTTPLQPSAGLLQARAALQAMDALAVAATPLAAIYAGARPALPNPFWGPCLQ